ncbi:MAG TPA: hypothetical protein VLA61_12165 [Ideonella sp.]|uniref:hypothetical protein n=1 Tax=Ideonella sp. TaxID=1929293 RepID=UPI002C64AEA7|nr:hypothetical protein [Ideonella sp.]HSI49017.1 hypothetical protein [Ideonella sp.]
MFSLPLTDETRMSPTRLLQRLLRRRPSATVPPSRIEIRPPALWGQAEPVWQSVWSWMRQSPVTGGARPSVLDKARQDFCAALGDLHGEATHDLSRRASHARSLRELWHLRAELYSLIAFHLNQTEADRRLAQVNRHFPARAAGTATNVLQSTDRHAQRHNS